MALVVLTIPINLARVALHVAARAALVGSRAALAGSRAASAAGDIAEGLRDLAQASAELSRARITVHGRVTVRNNVASINQALRQAAAAAVAQTAQELVLDAKAEAPVRTGRLRDSIHIAEQTETRAIVEVGAPYGAGVNYGHHTAGGTFVPGNPFWDRAVERARRRLEDNLQKELRQRLR